MNDRIIIAIMLAAAFVVVLNETIMTVALPHLMVDFQITANTAQWLTTAYMLTMAVVIPTTGFIIQRFTTRVVFIGALALFAAGTLLAAMAPGFEQLLAGRIVQASGAAVMLPLLMTTVLSLAPAGGRGALLGLVTVVLAAAPAIGPAVSGLILQFLPWRFLFILLLPIAVVAAAMGMAFLRNIGETRRRSLDILSVVLAVVGFGPLVLGFSELGEAVSEGSRIVLGCSEVIVGAGFVALFAWRQRALQTSNNSLLDIRVFSVLPFRRNLAILLLCMAAYFGALLIVPYYVQRVLGLDTLATGLIMLPGGVLMGVMGPISGRVFDRRGARLPIVFGTTMLVAAFVGLSFVTVATPAWLVALLVAALMGLGMGAISTPAVTGALESLAPRLYTHGNASIASLQQLAGASGSALVIAALSICIAASDATGVITGELTGVRIGFVFCTVAAVVAFGLSFRLVGGSSTTRFRGMRDVSAESNLRPVVRRTSHDSVPRTQEDR